MVRISVPKPPKDAYNPDRPAGTLLREQLKHLEWAVRPAAERTPGKIEVPEDLTEAEAAARVAALMAELHQKTVGREPVIAPKSRGSRRRPRRTPKGQRPTRRKAR